MRFLPAVVAVSLLLPGGAAASGAVKPGTVTRTYAASTADIANPGRGFFTYSETHLAAGVAYVPLDAATLAGARTEQGRSLVYRIFYLEKYQAVDRISATDLALIRADFAAARTAGVKLVVRFAYTAESDADAPADRVVGHLGQLGVILRENADILAAVQAGLIGRWGEWYYTRNFTAEADRKRVLDTLLRVTSPATPVQVRTPRIRRTFAPTVARVGVHNDCFLASADDYGTYVGDDRAWLARQSATALVGGETCAVSGYSGWANASAELRTYHWTYLNPSFHLDVLNSWGAAGLAEAGRRLGYRLRLVGATLPARATAGGTVTARITLTNDGYAAPVQNRPVRLVLTAGAVKQVVAVPADVRTWQPGKTATLTVRFAAPRTAGSYRLALSLPDPAATLSGTPAYAIQLANTGVWDATTGVNVLGATLTVTRS